MQVSIVGRSRKVVTGWGKTSPIRANIARPESVDSAVFVVSEADRVVGRGLGRSYGDAAQVSGGQVIDMTGLNRILEFDADSGIVNVEAGTSIEHLIETLVPQSWFVPVTPGTRFVTVGGAIGSDVHGKNHHRVASFGSHVRELTLLTGSGEVVTASPELNADVFWATVGGMGLTGLILTAKVAMRPVETAMMVATTERAKNLDAVMTRMIELDPVNPYTVAWIDCVARGARFGRGLITYGDHARLNQIPAGWEPLDVDLPSAGTVPIDLPSLSLNRVTIAAFNELWFRKVPKRPTRGLVSFADFFHPLDMIGDWNRIYGRAGFIQYQFVVPDSRADLIRIAIERITDVGGSAFLTVLKRFGSGNSGHLSFPIEGWTLALDVPARLAGLGRVLDELDQQVVQAGGRVYLSKDSRMRPDVLPAMYPRLDEWREVRQRLDPNEKFTSNLALRLGI